MLALATLTGSLAALPLASPAGAVATATVAYWSLDESAGASTMVDSSGFGRHGAIGFDVTTGATYQGATGHQFAAHFPREEQEFPGHVNKVPHHSSLNPGTSEYSFEIRLRTNYRFGNIMQKGQGATPGGYWKLENPEGKPRCLFRGGNRASRTGYSTIDISDNQWHTIRCNRTANYVEMYVDGVRTSRLWGSTGSISNNWELSLGGKSRCNGSPTTCDYFIGQVDYVRILKGSGGTPPPPPPPPPPTGDDISYVAGQTANRNTTNHRVTLPGSIDPGDLVLLFLSHRSVASTGSPGGGGWTRFGVLQGGSSRTSMWYKTAASGDAGSTVLVPLSRRVKGNMIAAAYRGVDTSDPIAAIASLAATGSSAQRTTPFATVSDPDDWALSYWMHGDSSTSSFVVPAGVVPRSNSSQTGGGRVSVLFADSNGAAAVGSYGGLTAQAASATRNNTTWTVILRAD